MLLNKRHHWDNIYATKREDELSWFQPYPKTSLAFVDLLKIPTGANIIDIGGGDSHFVDALLDWGYENIWVLDISGNAIDRAKKRLGERASKVHWIVSDMLDFEPPVKFDFWHDRAAFHFLTTEEKISRYVSIAEDAVSKNGYLLPGTFAENGPEKCSGLEIKRYSEASMSGRFEMTFEKIKCSREDHTTPFKTVQDFIFCCFRKK